MIATWITWLSDYLWEFFLPLLILLGLFINIKMLKVRDKISEADSSPWDINKMRGAFSISVASKVGTGAIIGVLAAMWQGSAQGAGGEAIVFWVLVGMFLLVPITYSEVLFTQICKQSPRDFIHLNLNSKMARFYAFGLVALYAFGFVGFQLTGVQTVIGYISMNYFDYQFNADTALFYIVIPMVSLASLIVITKNHHLFINVLSSLIFMVILVYIFFFFLFVYSTQDFISEYFSRIYADMMNFRSATFGIPIGIIIAFQRIIQISETSLGTSALSSSDRENSPRREALIQTVATVLSIGVAVIISSYIFSYGLSQIEGVDLVGNGIERIRGFLVTVYAVTGYVGLSVVILFFIISGFTTTLSSFHYVNTCLKINENSRVITYIFLISASGVLSVTHFDLIFEVVNLLMFTVGIINLLAMANYIYKIDLSFSKLQFKESL